MEVHLFPSSYLEKHKHDEEAFVRYVSEMYQNEGTIIIAGSFRQLLNLRKLEEKNPTILLQALVFTVRDPPVFVAFTLADLGGQAGKASSPRCGPPQEVEIYVAKLARSLSSNMQLFSEERICMATAIVDTSDLESLGRRIAEARSSLPASRRGMTEAVYDSLMLAFTAALGLGALKRGLNGNENLHLVNDLKNNTGRMRRIFSRLGQVVLRLEDVQRPRISSSLTPYNLVRTLDLTKPTLVICSDRNRELLKEVLMKFKWEVATKSTDEQANHLHGNVIVVGMGKDEASHIADISKAGTIIWVDCRDEAHLGATCAALPPCQLDAKQLLGDAPVANSDDMVGPSKRGSLQHGLDRDCLSRGPEVLIPNSVLPPDASKDSQLEFPRLPKVASGLAPVKKEGGEEWECPNCTFLNIWGHTCEMCCSHISLSPPTEKLEPLGIGGRDPRPVTTPMAIGGKADDSWTSLARDELRIVLLGRTGRGKSATGNCILDRKEFQTMASAKEVMAVTKQGTARRFDRTIHVVDTPGLFDPCITNDKVITEITKCFGKTSPGAHAFIVVLQIYRFTWEDKQTVEEFTKYFGPFILKYLLVLFTHTDGLEGMPLRDYVQNVPEELKELLRSCDHRYIGFNNKASQGEKEQQVQQLLRMIDDMVRKNGGTCYTNEMYKEVEKAIRDDMERKKRDEIEKIEMQYAREKHERDPPMMEEMQGRMSELQASQSRGDETSGLSEELKTLRDQIAQMNKEEKQRLREIAKKVKELETKYQKLEEDTRNIARKEVEGKADGFSLVWHGDSMATRDIVRNTMTALSDIAGDLVSTTSKSMPAKVSAKLLASLDQA